MVKKQYFVYLVLLLTAGFSILTWMNASKNAQEMEVFIIDHELPTIGLSLQLSLHMKALVYKQAGEALLQDGFIESWILNGERDVPALVDFMENVRARYGLLDASLVSDETETYYGTDGRVVSLSPTTWERDGWYYIFREAVRDNAGQSTIDSWYYPEEDFLGIYVNVPVYDSSGTFLGVTGGGINAAEFRESLDAYEAAFPITVYLARRDGSLVYSSNPDELKQPVSIGDKWGDDFFGELQRNRTTTGVVHQGQWVPNDVMWSSYMEDWDTYVLVRYRGMALQDKVESEWRNSILRSGIPLGIALVLILGFSFLLERRVKARFLAAEKNVSVRDCLLYMTTCLVRQSRSDFIRQEWSEQKFSDLQKLRSALGIRGLGSRDYPSFEQFSVARILHELILDLTPMAVQSDVAFHATIPEEVASRAGLPGITRLLLEDLFVRFLINAEAGAAILVGLTDRENPRVSVVFQTKQPFSHPDLELCSRVLGDYIGITLETQSGQEGGTIYRISFPHGHSECPS